jgi:hypothetical protein
MATKKRCKAYKPRDVNPNAMNWALAGAHLLPLDKQRELVGYVDEAFSRLRQGTASRDDWNALANGMNIAEALAFFKIVDNLLPEICEALDALHAVALRMLDGRGSRLTSDEQEALSFGRDIYKGQLEHCTQGEAMRAVQRVQDLHRSGAMQDVARLYQEMAA